MPQIPRFPLSLPLQGLALTGLCAVYLIVGLIGHDPWKNDDAVHFGVAYSLLDSHDWMFPRLAGEAYLDTPPLYHWVAAFCVKLFGWLLPQHDAVRLASAIFGALFLGLLCFASRLLNRLRPAAADSRENQSGSAAALIAIGCLGLLVPIHDTQPMIALLAASAATYAGLALLPLQPGVGGILAGVGLGLGFFASGLPALLTLAPLLLVLPANRNWSHRSALGGIAITLAVSVSLCAIWPLLLLHESPDRLRAWWALAIAGTRYQSAWYVTLTDHAELLAWFAWPALPLAAWAIWLNRKQLGQPPVFLPLAGTVTCLVCLLLVYGPRPLAALPLLVPLALLAANSANRLRRGASNAFDWFGMMTFTLVGGLIWLGAIAMAFGVPAQIAHNFSKLEPGFVAHFSWPVFAGGALLSIAWLWLIVAGPRSPLRAVTNWAAGTTLVWALLTTLWMPWIDYGKSYRGVAIALQQAISKLRFTEQIPTFAAKKPCIAGRNLGGAQRISLQYFAGIVTLRQDAKAGRACPLLLEQGSEREGQTPAGWRKIWEGHRPGDRSERLRLYQREADSQG